MCEIWKGVWGADANRVVCVMGTQAANFGVAKLTLGCSLWSHAPCATNHGITALAIAPYFEENVPSSWLSQPDGGLDYLFTEAMQGGVSPSGYPGGTIKRAISWVTANKTIADQYHLDLIAYEGGQGYLNPSDLDLTNLYIAANRDARMGTATESYLRQWKDAGGKLFNYFASISQYDKWGSWGALESVMQTSSPKYHALMKFIDTTPVWWCPLNSTNLCSPLPTSPDPVLLNQTVTSP